MRAVFVFSKCLFNVEFLNYSSGRFVSYGSGESYLYNPSEFGFEDDEVPLLPDGKYIGVGASKVVKVLEGPHRNPIMSVNVDGKLKKVFYSV